MIDRYCLPSPEAVLNSTIVKHFKEAFFGEFLSDKFSEYLADAFAVWYVLAISVGSAFILGLIFMLFLRCCAGVIIFFCLIAIFILLGGSGVWFYLVGRAWYVDKIDGVTFSIFDASTFTITNERNFNIMTYCSYALWGLCGLYLIILLCLCNRIRLGVAIIKTTARFIQNTWSVFLIPIFFTVILGGFICYWVYTAAYIFSTGEISKRDAPLSFATQVKWSEQTRYIFIYHLFGLLWVNAFIIGCA